MKTLLHVRSTVEPAAKVIGKSTVDVNRDITVIQVPKAGVSLKKVYPPEELETVYDYTVDRYSLQEYLAKQDKIIDDLGLAIVELFESSGSGA